MLFRFVIPLGLLVACSAMPDCHLREIDICSSSLAVFAKPMAVGEDADYGRELENRCDMVDETFSCLSNYTQDCTKEMHADLFEWALSGAKKIKESLCAPGTQIREEYMRHIPCIQTLMRRSEKPCVNDLKAGLEAIINSKPKARKAMGCCVMNRFRTCKGNEIEQECGLDAQTFLQKVSRIAFSRLPEYMCADFTPQSGLCDDMPAEGAKMMGVKSRYKLLSHLMSYLKRQEQ